MVSIDQKKKFVEQELGFPIEEIGLISIGNPQSINDLQIYHKKKDFAFLIENDEVSEKLILYLLILGVPRVEKKMTKIGRYFFRMIDRITFRGKNGIHWKSNK